MEKKGVNQNSSIKKIEYKQRFLKKKRKKESCQIKL